MTKWTAEQTKAIYESGQNIIVSAGAGSGKTAVLTERVLEKVKNGISLSNLLILTFTKLAAKEMRERIGAKLKKENFLDEIAKLDSADITTFDAYALSVVKKYHYYLGVSKKITIIDASVIELYKRKTLTAIFEELYQNEDSNFLSLISEYFIKDDKELFNYILMLNNKLDLKPNKDLFLDTYLEEHFSPQRINNDINTYLNKLFELIRQIETQLTIISDSEFAEKMNMALSSLLTSKNYLDIKQALEIKMPPARNVSDESKKAKEKITSLLKEIKKLTIYEDEIEIKESILKTKPHLETIISIIRELSKRITKYKEEYDAYEYSDIAHLAIKLVKENKDVQKEIKDNLNEILIDEYQDTNDIQEEFISYISNNNVYMVGDIKQSIYRFRNANPYIFKTKYDNYSLEKGGIKIDLNKNFRSREEVINNINYLFNQIMDDTFGGASYQKSHQMIFGNNTYNEGGKSQQNNNFEIYNYLNDTNYQKEEIESFIIANDIKKKIQEGYLCFDRNLNANRKVEYSDFAILLANSSSFDLYKKILEYLDIPVTIMKKGNLTDGEVIVIIKNIVKLIIKIKENKFDSEFKKLFLSLGRSFLFNISDNKLFSYFLEGNFTSSEIYIITKEISQNIDAMPLPEVLDTIIDTYNFNEKLILLGDYSSNILRLDKLKEITSTLVNLNYSIYDYQLYLDDIISNNLKIEYDIPETSSNAVKIMTIHASKGLEFGICYYSELSSKFNLKEAISKYSYDDKYGIIFPYKKDFIYNTIYHYLSYYTYIEENISERIRLFYVAVTRAREKMIFILPQNQKEPTNFSSSIVDDSIRSKYSSFASFIYSLEPNIKKYYHNVDLTTLKLTKDYNLIKDGNYQQKISITDKKITVVPLPNIGSPKTEESSFSKKQTKLITKEEQSKLDYGKKMHEILELIDFNNINYHILKPREQEMINNLLSSLDIKKATIYKEYEFIYEEGNTVYHGIIDLLLVYEDKIKIVDYKLKNIDDIAYLKQLNGYKKYIENTFKKKVELYLYSIIDNHLEKLN